ncbi:MAG: hypothetical protein A4E44_01954 [Methanosaeta sp. PtaB.Bin018]|nr:MAG: hypothetical protein A4E44_01954 [Methanosaeta sp. PtaB.Bin018]OPY46733.1 MAG: hypothetical protein A4E46_00791 [Methanosaeta sp. PtaU1.Bin016]
MQALCALVALLVYGHCLGQLFLYLGGVGDNGDLHLLDEGHLCLVQLNDRGEDLYPGGDSLLLQALSYPHPDIISLVEVHEAADVGEQGVVAPLDDGLQVLLDLLSGNLEYHAEGDCGAFLDILEVGADNCDLSILNLVHRGSQRQLESICLGAAKLYP